MSGPPVRHAVIELLLAADHNRSDFTEWPWHLIHKDGRPFSEAENLLANSATIEEATAAQRLAMAAENFYTRKRDALARAFGLISAVPGWEEMTLAEVAARLPEHERAEVTEILSRYPDALQDASNSRTEASPGGSP